MLEADRLPQQVPFRQRVQQEAPKMVAKEQIPLQTKLVKRGKSKHFTSQPPVCQPCSLSLRLSKKGALTSLAMRKQLFSPQLLPQGGLLYLFY